MSRIMEKGSYSLLTIFELRVFTDTFALRGKPSIRQFFTNWSSYTSQDLSLSKYSSTYALVA